MVYIFLRQIFFICRLELIASVRLYCAVMACGLDWRNKSRACLNTKRDTKGLQALVFSKQGFVTFTPSEFSRAVTVTKYNFHIPSNSLYLWLNKAFISIGKDLTMDMTPFIKLAVSEAINEKKSDRIFLWDRDTLLEAETSKRRKS